MGIEHLQMAGERRRDPHSITILLTDHGKHGKSKPQILHPPEVEGDLNGQRTKENAEKRRSFHHQTAMSGTVPANRRPKRAFQNPHEPYVVAPTLKSRWQILPPIDGVA
jgi:hypothetical protein